LGVAEACLVIEEVARGCAATAMALQMSVNGPPKALANLGTEEQKRRLLPGVVAGTRLFSIAMTEPDAGSDGISLQAALRGDGDGWRLSGTKCYITAGARADSYLVFCRAEGSQGPRGIGAVIVERGQDGFAEPQVDGKMGVRGVPEATLRFDDVRIEPENVLITPEPESKAGAGILLTQFNPERCGNAAMSIGIARAAFDASLAFTSTREQFGRPIIEFQGLQWMIADMAVDIEAARHLLRSATSTSDQNGFPRVRETAMAKLFANEMARRVTDKSVQLHGHRGYATTHEIERYFRDARGMSLGGGTTEILRNMIASAVTGRRFPQRS
jgi:alkylation response protein AidB-like acyl-CoA dehydrogenase